MKAGVNPAAKWLLLLATVALIVLHQDWWNWDQVDPRFLGFLPIGLTYHAGFAVACAALMFCLVRFAWPAHLEQAEKSPAPARDDSKNAAH